MENIFNYNSETKYFEKSTKIKNQNKPLYLKTAVVGTLAMSVFSTNSLNQGNIVIRNNENNNSKILREMNNYLPSTEVHHTIGKNQNNTIDSHNFNVNSLNKEESIMSKKSYTKNEIDLKLENLSAKVDNRFELLSQKIDNGFTNQSLLLENQLNSFKLEQSKTRTEIIRWYVGTVISVIGLVLAYLALK